MTEKATVTEAEMSRAMKAAVKAGLTVYECIVTRDNVRLILVDKKNPAVKNVRMPEPWD